VTTQSYGLPLRHPSPYGLRRTGPSPNRPEMWVTDLAPARAFVVSYSIVKQPLRCCPSGAGAGIHSHLRFRLARSRSTVTEMRGRGYGSRLALAALACPKDDTEIVGVIAP